MGNKNSTQKLLNKPNDEDDPSVWRQSRTLTKVKFSDDTKKDSFCNPGPSPKFIRYKPIVKFDPKIWKNVTYQKKINLLPFVTYLNNYDSNDNEKYACNPGQYIKYEDGHYCCVDESNRATPQDMLNFINMSLESLFQNVGFSSAPNSITMDKYKYSVKDLEFLLHHREKIMYENPTLIDNLEVPPDIDENGNEIIITLDQWVDRYKTFDPVVSDFLEGTPESENRILSGMRSERKSDGSPFYRAYKDGTSRFGGTKRKKRKNIRKRTVKKHIKYISTINGKKICRRC